VLLAYSRKQRGTARARQGEVEAGKARRRSEHKLFDRRCQTEPRRNCEAEAICLGGAELPRRVTAYPSLRAPSSSLKRRLLAPHLPPSAHQPLTNDTDSQSDTLNTLSHNIVRERAQNGRQILLLPHHILAQA
jgi:hypothetical protein